MEVGFCHSRLDRESRDMDTERYKVLCNVTCGSPRSSQRMTVAKVYIFIATLCFDKLSMNGMLKVYDFISGLPVTSGMTAAKVHAFMATHSRLYPINLFP